MRKLLIVSVAASFAAGSVLANPAVVTTNVNFRSGPGTNFDPVGKLSEGSEVDIKECDASGNWCAVEANGKTGFVSGRYLSQGADDKAAPAWPRTYTGQNGASLTLFQPQVSDWENFTKLDALIAAELKVTKDAAPIYGVIGITAKTVADDETGNVVLTEMTPTQVDFSTLDKDQLAKLALGVNKIMPTDPVTVSQDRLTASLADYKRLNDVSGLKADPPPIFISKAQAVLVQTDGKAVVSPVKGVKGLSFVVNTNWDLFQVDADKTYYLRDEKSWLKAGDLKGPWSAAISLPAELSSLPDGDDWKDAKAAMPPAAFDKGAPQVYYSDTPSELVIFTGEPALEKVPGTGLEWASNTSSDVFYRPADRNWYVLLSGRWFSAQSLDGPWTFATPNLPADFQNIPTDASYYSVRASVPGTSESAEARLKASIPQMARVLTDGSVKVDVAYSGEPKFQPIDGTSLAYAENSNETVIKVADKYFVLKSGIWFVGDTPTGPFTVAKAVPDEIYKIPPSSPVYNVTYVRIYDSEPNAVWYGYTAGYLGAYLAWDALVWGTGWLYPPYWDFGWAGGGYWPYYPRPVTYGVGAFYNPAYGTFGRYGYAYGPYRGIAGGAAYNPRTGTYIRGGAIAGPNGSRGFVSAYNPRTGNGFTARGGQNVYGSWGSASVRHGGEFTHVAGGATDNAAGLRWHNSEGNHGFIAGGKGGDVYAGRDGNVYRRDNGEWQKRTPDGWQPVNKPYAESLKTRGQQFSEKHPDAANRMQDNAANRPAQNANRISNKETVRKARAPDNLALDRIGRQTGNQRDLSRDFGRGDIGQFEGRNFGGREFGGREFGGGGFHGGGGFRRR